MSEETLHLYASVPVCGFRVAQAREYWETYPCPPPSTVYGMLLSVVGESDRLHCEGAEVAFALLSPQPNVSVILRTMWRIKTKENLPGTGKNKTPDFQELLTNVQLSVWVRKGANENSVSLLQRLREALKRPASVHRFGGLCLGESSHLVDEVREYRSCDPHDGWLLVRDSAGDLSLPIWPDHVGSKNTRWDQFTLHKTADAEISRQHPPDDNAWVSINRIN